jgi:hypothetical protein
MVGSNGPTYMVGVTQTTTSILENTGSHLSQVIAQDDCLDISPTTFGDTALHQQQQPGGSHWHTVIFTQPVYLTTTTP